MRVVKRAVGRIILFALLGAAAAHAQTTQEKPTSGTPSNAASASADCDKPGKPLPPEKIAGAWTSPKNGAKLELTQSDPKSTAKFDAKGQFSWDGSFASGKLTLTRTPKAQEMSGAAPDWARQKVEGQIKWTMELEPKIKCGTPVLEGKWYPGAFSYEADYDDNDQLISERASVTDPKGSPIDVLYVRSPPRVLLLAKGVDEPIIIDKLYRTEYHGELNRKIPLMIGVLFDEPNDQDSFPVTVSAGGRNIELTAKPSDDRRLFETEIFHVNPK